MLEEGGSDQGKHNSNRRSSSEIRQVREKACSKVSSLFVRSQGRVVRGQRSVGRRTLSILTLFIGHTPMRYGSYGTVKTL